MSDIPHHLLEQIKLGNVILFLGAGATYGAKAPDGHKMPNGRELADLIIDRFLGSDYKGSELAYAAELAISESSLYELQSFIADIIKPIEPEPYHLKIPTFRWKSVFTTNYDLIIEKAYNKAIGEIQELKPVYKNTNKRSIFTSTNVLPYYKIHGCITDINDKEAPLILTPDQFVNYKSKRDRLFNDLVDFSYDYPILFVGFGMQDYDIRTVLNGLDSNIDARVRSYMIGPNIRDLDTKMWEQKKVSTLKMTFSDFLEKIDGSIDKNVRILSSIRPVHKHPIYDKFVTSITELAPSNDFVEYIETGIDFIHPNLSAPNTSPQLFYKGYFDNWDPIIKNLDATRVIKDGILSEVFLESNLHDSSEQHLFVIKGNGGSGKSVLLKRIAYDAGVHFDRFCIYLRPDSYIKPTHILQLFTYVKDRIYIFVDDIVRFEEDIVYLLNKAKKDNIKITVFGTARNNVWNTECKYLLNHLTSSYKLKSLHEKEIINLIQLLERYDSLGTLKDKTDAERIKAFKTNASGELLVALYEATNGSKPFEDIIYDEYKSINNPQAQSLYLTVSIFHRLGAEARAGFISRVHNISFHNFKDSLFAPLEGIIYDKKDNRINDFVYLTRNKLIAEIIFSRVLSEPQDKYDEFIRILKNLNADYESDRIALISITNAKKLLEVFDDPSLVREIYQTAEDQSGKNSKLSQQKAIFEMSKIGTFSSAQKYLQEAFSLDENDPFILHTSAEFALKKAEKSTYNTEFYSCIDDCVEICNNVIKKIKKNPTPHPYHTILKAYILKLEHILKSEDTPAIERAIKDIEKAFVDVKQLFPNEEFILEAESSFNEIIKNTKNARELLEKAFNANKSSPYLASRLSTFLEKEGELEEAISVVKQALENTSSTNDKDLNFKYASLLQKRDNPNYSLISTHLRRSFTSGDTRYQAQLYYARALFIIAELQKASEIFATLTKVNIAPDVKYKASLIIYRNGVPVLFEGSIKNKETTYGFIRRDGHADEIFFYRYEDNCSHSLIWENIQRGKRVSFNIGFNYKGPVAVNIKLL